MLVSKGDIKMENKIIVVRNGGNVVVCNEHCQKMIVTDPNLLQKNDEEIKLHYEKVFNDIKKVANQRIKKS